MKHPEKNRVKQSEIERFEQKLVFQPDHSLFILECLRHACFTDPEYPENPVFSLYFDTPSLDSFHECLDGDIYKNKVRLRWYKTPVSGKSQIAYIEVKSKVGFRTSKHRKAIKLRGDILMQPNLITLPQKLLLEEVLPEIGYIPKAPLNPVILIYYQRRRFQEPLSGLSITYDTNISSWPILPNLPYKIPGITLPNTVLELKGNTTDFPMMLDPIRRVNPIWSSFSKYAKCLELYMEKPGPPGYLRR